jgi:hypothetical protein
MPPAALDYADRPARRGIAYAASPGRLSVIVPAPESKVRRAIRILALAFAGFSFLLALWAVLNGKSASGVAGLVIPAALLAFTVWAVFRRRLRVVALDLDDTSLRVDVTRDADTFTTTLPRSTLLSAYANYEPGQTNDVPNHWDLYLHVAPKGVRIISTQLPEADARWLVKQINTALGRAPSPPPP